MNTSEAPAVELTPELQRALDASGGKPPVLVDRRTQETYVLIRSAVYEQLTGNKSPASDGPEVPEGIRQARAAFLRDFPALMADRATRGRYVVYHKGERVIVAGDYRAAIAEAVRRNIPEDEYLVLKVVPGADREQQDIA